MTVRLLGLAILVTTFAGCNCGGTADGPDSGDPNNPPIEDVDAGTRRDGGGGSSGIVVTCDPVPAAVPVNTQVRITCNIDSGGKSLSEPELTASPSGGVELANGSQMGQVLFSLSTGKPGYTHPTNFADTVFTINVRVRNAAKASEYGEGTATVTVLGNYWIGDGTSGGGVGIFVHLSDGAYLRSVVGPAGFTGVSDLRMLPSGDIVASSMSRKAIKVFNRQGVEQAPAAFEDKDRWTGMSVWDDTGTFGTVGPRQMAVSSLGELWVTGARTNKTWGIAVFNPGTGALQKFVPSPETNNPWVFTSIARRTDGKMAVSSSERRSICLFDEKTYATSGCVLVDNNGFASYSTLLGLPDARLLCGIDGDSTNGDPLYLLNPTLGVEQIGEGKTYDPVMTALAVHGAEYLALGSYGDTVGNILVRRFDKTTLKEITPAWDVGPKSHYMPVGAGLVRLTTPGL